MTDVLVVGAALFAMFFGAGNLLFPPTLGYGAGSEWFTTALGFIITGVGLPILGIIALCKNGGTVADLSDKVHPLFTKILSVIIILALGPVLAIPRTAATVFEVGIEPMIPGVKPIWIAVIYFVITWAFTIKPSGVVDKIGKILTPLLVLMMGIIIFKGVLNPIGEPVFKDTGLAFGNGFSEGYQTMDALGSILLGGLALVALKEKGYTESKEKLKLATQAGIIAGLGLAFVYMGLIHIGAMTSSLYEAPLSRAGLLIEIGRRVLGESGQLGLCLAVSAACLTTAIGLTAVVGNFFDELTNGKIKYELVVTLVCLSSIYVASQGVEAIVNLAVPLLVISYPIVILIIVMNLFSEWIVNPNAYRGAIIGATIVSFSEVFGFDWTKVLPLSNQGFAWIVPAIILGVIGSIIKSKSNKIDNVKAA
jgi:LIVCS family branched-chain amino acid:cation transporter